MGLDALHRGRALCPGLLCTHGLCMGPPTHLVCMIRTLLYAAPSHSCHQHNFVCSTESLVPPLAPICMQHQVSCVYLAEREVRSLWMHDFLYAAPSHLCHH
jgi:hypothetical protein